MLELSVVTFILPGYSPRNREWAEEVAKSLKISGEVRPIFWDHWTDPIQTLRPKEKAELIVRLASKKGQINIIAKSVGTLIAAYIARAIPDRIEKVVLCGVPSTSLMRQKIFGDAFSNFPPEKIIVYQNDGDPFKKPDEIKTFFSKINTNIKVIAKPRRDHNYPYYEEFNAYLTSDFRTA